MNRRSFGELVKALREESKIRHPDMHKITQEELARQLVSLYQNSPEDKEIETMCNTLARIEQGKKKYIDPALLVYLATAFELTSREREQFFLAATGIENQQRTNQNLPPMANILGELERLVAHMQSPAMVVDFHGDIVIFNYAMLRMYGQNTNTLNQIPVYNLLLALFELSHAIVTEEYFEERLIQNIRFIRANSLLYRNDDYFVQLLNYAATRYKRFSYFWQWAYSSEDIFSQSVVHDHHHQEFGRLKYMNAVSTTITQVGTLSLLAYIPVNREASQAFLKLAQEQNAVRNSNWPEHKEHGRELFK